jgi:WXG100 family type VII secretion target
MAAGDGSRYTVRYSEVATVIEDMGMATNSIRAALDTLIEDINKNLNPANWTSDAKDAFTHAQQNWNSDCTNMHSVLKSAESTLTDIVTNYDITDRQAAALYGQVGL